jgi:heptosyltransferase-2
MNEDPKSILVVKYRALGDSIMGLSTISYLRSIYPNSKIYYAVRKWTARLYQDVKIDADEVIGFNLNDFSGYRQLWQTMRRLKVDHVHELHVSGRTKRFFKLYSLLTKTKYTYHDHHILGGGRVLDQGEKKELIQRDLDGIYSYLGKHRPHPSFLDFTPKMNEIYVSKDNSVVLGVVATRSTKMWPLNHYVQLAERIHDEFPHLKIKVPLSNSSEDQKIQNELKQLDKRHILSFIKEPLNELPITMAKSQLYIGNDTGLKHLAIACGVKTYTLFGPEPPREWHPYDKNKHPYFYIDGLECRTKDAHFCGLDFCDTMICMNQISVRQVFDKVSKDLM